MKVNYGWKITLIAWILTPFVMVLVPEISTSNGFRIPSYLLWDLLVTVAFFGALTGVVWIPVGLRASKGYKAEGRRKAVKTVLKAFIILNVIWLIIFFTIWNY